MLGTWIFFSITSPKAAHKKKASKSIVCVAKHLEHSWRGALWKSSSLKMVHHWLNSVRGYLVRSPRWDDDMGYRYALSHTHNHPRSPHAHTYPRTHTFATARSKMRFRELKGISRRALRNVIPVLRYRRLYVPCNNPPRVPALFTGCDRNRYRYCRATRDIPTYAMPTTQ